MSTYSDVVAHHKQKQKERELQRLRDAVAKSDQIPEPPTDKESTMERHRQKEAHASWKVVCSCGTVKYYSNMDIGQLNDIIQHSFHPQHTKAVFYRENMGSHQFRGRIPAMVSE